MEITTAVIQLNAGEDLESNLVNAVRLCNEAADQGAELICLPEMFNYRPISLPPKRRSESLDGPSLAPLKALAISRGVTIIAGSMGEAIPNSTKLYNTSAVISPKGDIQAVYRKINLFDAHVDGVDIRESSAYEKGASPVVTEVNGFKVGLSVCFDIRFSSLYQHYKQAGVDIIVIPSSFTSRTGEAHWEVLCRARAIETQSYVLAPNQIGKGTREVETYGHSMVVDPWGKVLKKASGHLEEILICRLSKAEIQTVREKIPT
jgi:predicted amidohydrolase